MANCQRCATIAPEGALRDQSTPRASNGSLQIERGVIVPAASMSMTLDSKYDQDSRPTSRPNPVPTDLAACPEYSKDVTLNYEFPYGPQGSGALSITVQGNLNQGGVPATGVPAPPACSPTDSGFQVTSVAAAEKRALMDVASLCKEGKCPSPSVCQPIINSVKSVASTDSRLTYTESASFSGSTVITRTCFLKVAVTVNYKCVCAPDPAGK